jgi:hypothetical protein
MLVGTGGDVGGDQWGIEESGAAQDKNRDGAGANAISSPSVASSASTPQQEKHSQGSTAQQGRTTQKQHPRNTSHAIQTHLQSTPSTHTQSPHSTPAPLLPPPSTAD